MSDEYNLGSLPALVYYRHQIPILYEGQLSELIIHFEHWHFSLSLFILTHTTKKITGELSKEEDVLEWLIENKSTGDDEEVIEDVTAKTLSTLIGNVDNLVVLFCMYFHPRD